MREVDTTRFNRKLEQWAIEVGASATTALKIQGRLLIKQCINFTPPTLTKDQRSAEKESGENRNAKQILEHKIQRDLRKIFAVASEGFLDKLGRRAGDTNVDAWVGEKGNVNLHVLFGKIDAPGSGMKAWHYSQRNSRGSVGGRSRITLRWAGNKVREWKAPYAVSTTAFADYLRATLAKVGRMKSGWLPAYRALGGGEGSFRVPPWVKVHGGDRVGWVDASMLADKKLGSITINNHARGIGVIRHLVQSALRARGEAMERDMRLYIAGIKRRLNY